MSVGVPGADQSARKWVWFQLFVSWLPVWALYVALMLAVHGGSVGVSAIVASRAIAAAAVLSLLVTRLVNRLPWPRRISASFVFAHTAAAFIFAPAWVGLTSLIESVLRWRLVLSGPPGGLAPFLILGLWLYIALVGVLYAVRATARAGRAEAAAAESQLAALRSHLNPHFLFNALHTVVQLIPIDPKRASSAAEELAGLLRTALEEDRDVVPLRAECAFVERYLALERMRFGDRLIVAFDIEPAAIDVPVPAFALQTLVENAVRHGASPNIQATRIDITARVDGASLVLTVTDTGVGQRGGANADVNFGTSAPGAGTGLNRLRARLDALYGARGRLNLAPDVGRGFTATVIVPRNSATQD